MALGLYLHIPFCLRKCDYCSFYSLSYDRKIAEKYTDALCLAMETFQPERKLEVDTIFLGGGTPSLLGEENLARILQTAKQRFSVTSDAEITLETNPCTITLPLLKSLKKAGYNRISIGVQSLSDTELQALGRLHTAKEAKEAVYLAKEAGFTHISADLMVGIPHQTTESFLESLHEIAALPIDHLSAYLLSIESGTPFAQKRASLQLPNDDRMADLYELLCTEAEKLGFAQYEISNFAKEGGICRHNRHYWKCEEYLAFGPAAHGFLDGKRFSFSPSLPDYLAMAECGNFVSQEEGDGGDDEERLLLGMRLSEGVHLSDFSSFNDAQKEEILAKAREMEKFGYILFTDNDSFRFTKKGFCISNSLLSRLLSFD